MVKAVVITNLEHSAVDLRLLALALSLEGFSRTNAARQAVMERQTLRDWLHRYNESGVAGLRSKVASGPEPKLTAAQMAELRALVVAGPDPETDNIVRWRCTDLRDQVAINETASAWSQANDRPWRDISTLHRDVPSTS